jgi:hypothetical protein
LDLAKGKDTKGGNRKDDPKEGLKYRRGSKSHFSIAQTKAKKEIQQGKQKTFHGALRAIQALMRVSYDFMPFNARALCKPQKKP